MKKIIIFASVCVAMLLASCTSYKNVPYVINSDSLANVVRAMELYDNVGDLQLIQTLLGHKNIATTQIYAQVRDEKVAEMQKAITGGLINL